jgi:hypothetical protein
MTTEEQPVGSSADSGQEASQGVAFLFEVCVVDSGNAGIMGVQDSRSETAEEWETSTLNTS